MTWAAPARHNDLTMFGRNGSRAERSDAMTARKPLVLAGYAEMLVSDPARERTDAEAVFEADANERWTTRPCSRAYETIAAKSAATNRSTLPDRGSVGTPRLDHKVPGARRARQTANFRARTHQAGKTPRLMRRERRDSEGKFSSSTEVSGWSMRGLAVMASGSGIIRNTAEAPASAVRSWEELADFPR
jgi:hypothetical protein